MAVLQNVIFCTQQKSEFEVKMSQYLGEICDFKTKTLHLPKFQFENLNVAVHAKTLPPKIAILQENTTEILYFIFFMTKRCKIVKSSILQQKICYLRIKNIFHFWYFAQFLNICDLTVKSCDIRQRFWFLNKNLFLLKKKNSWQKLHISKFCKKKDYLNFMEKKNKKTKKEFEVYSKNLSRKKIPFDWRI